MLWYCYISWNIGCFFLKSKGHKCKAVKTLNPTNYTSLPPLSASQSHRLCYTVKYITLVHISNYLDLYKIYRTQPYELWLTSMCRVKSSWKLVYVLHADKCPFLCELMNGRFQRVCGMATGKYIQVAINGVSV